MFENINVHSNNYERNCEFLMGGHAPSGFIEQRNTHRTSEVVSLLEGYGACSPEKTVKFDPF